MASKVKKFHKAERKDETKVQAAMDILSSGSSLEIRNPKTTIKSTACKEVTPEEDDVKKLGLYQTTLATHSQITEFKCKSRCNSTKNCMVSDSEIDTLSTFGKDQKANPIKPMVTIRKECKSFVPVNKSSLPQVDTGMSSTSSRSYESKVTNSKEIVGKTKVGAIKDSSESSNKNARSLKCNGPRPATPIRASKSKFAYSKDITEKPEKDVGAKLENNSGKTGEHVKCTIERSTPSRACKNCVEKDGSFNGSHVSAGEKSGKAQFIQGRFTPNRSCKNKVTCIKEIAEQPTRDTRSNYENLVSTCKNEEKFKFIEKHPTSNSVLLGRKDIGIETISEIHVTSGKYGENVKGAETRSTPSRACKNRITNVREIIELPENDKGSINESPVFPEKNVEKAKCIELRSTPSRACKNNITYLRGMVEVPENDKESINDNPVFPEKKAEKAKCIELRSTPSRACKNKITYLREMVEVPENDKASINENPVFPEKKDEKAKCIEPRSTPSRACKNKVICLKTTAEMQEMDVGKNEKATFTSETSANENSTTKSLVPKEVDSTSESSCSSNDKPVKAGEIQMITSSMKNLEIADNSHLNRKMEKYQKGTKSGLEKFVEDHCGSSFPIVRLIKTPSGAIKLAEHGGLASKKVNDEVCLKGNRRPFGEKVENKQLASSHSIEPSDDLKKPYVDTMGKKLKENSDVITDVKRSGIFTRSQKAES